MLQLVPRQHIGEPGWSRHMRYIDARKPIDCRGDPDKPAEPGAGRLRHGRRFPDWREPIRRGSPDRYVCWEIDGYFDSRAIHRQNLGC